MIENSLLNTCSGGLAEGFKLDRQEVDSYD